MSFVTTTLSGRLGNQLFEIAACITTALKNNCEFLIPDYVETNDEAYIKHLPKYNGEKIRYTHIDNELKYQRINFKPDMMLRGYYQALEHTEGYLDEVIKILNLKYELNKGVVGIHIRRGDYVQLSEKHPWSKKYYQNSINYFIEKGYSHFKVYSDDIEWCKTFFKETLCSKPESYPFEYSEGLTAVKDMGSLSGCEHMICAASTFSIWAGYLNKNPDKIITRPNFFLGGNDARLYRNVYPKNWTMI